MKAIASPGDEAATPTASVPSGRGPESWNRFTGSGTTGRTMPADAAAARKLSRQFGVACQAPTLVQPPVARRDEHVVDARRGVVGQFQDRRAPLVAELPADGREQPLAPVTGVTDRQPAAVIGGIDRPHVPDLMTLNINNTDQVAAADADRAPGLGRHDHPPRNPARSAIHNLRHLPGPDSRPRSQPGSAVSLRIPATTFQTQTQIVRGYPAPDQRRVLGRLRTCRTKG